jgi:DNA repair protein RecO (recombination protein O)
MNLAKEQQAVYVLNRRPYQESSLLVDIFSLNYGRFTVVAKGAMRRGNAWAAVLQPFQPLLISWSGRSSLKTLRTVDVPSAPYKLSANYLFSAYYLNELILKLLPENEINETVFAGYLRCLTELAEAKDLQQSLRVFEYTILRDLGLLPDFEMDIHGNRIDRQSSYHLIPQNGFELVDASYVGSDNRLVIKGSVLLSLNEGDGYSFKNWSREEYLQAKQLMRCLIDEAVGGQPIKSRELFKPVKY